MTSWVPPSVSDFQAFFNRDFPYPPAGTITNPLDYVQPADITKAINEAVINFNPSLFGSIAQITNIFMYLAAFYLVCNLQISAKGIAAQLNFPTVSVGVGSVNQAFQVPEKYAKDPFLAQYTSNGYGMKYLTMVLPFTVGNIGLAKGTTTNN